MTNNAAYGPEHHRDVKDMDLFDKYCEAQSEIEVITRFDTFSYALKFGVLFMTEIFMGMSEVAGFGNVEL